MGDKERLYDRLFDGGTDALFEEARIRKSSQRPSNKITILQTTTFSTLCQSANRREYVMSWIKVRFLNKAVDFLCANSYIYMFAYHSQKNN